MRWAEIDLEGAVWTLPAHRTKNGKQHITPLSAAALDVLAVLPRIGDEFVFTAADRRKESGYPYSAGKRRIDALLPADMPHWTLHDLRRTLATGLQRLGIRLEVTEAVLNHVSGSRAGVVGVYQRHAWNAEKRTALEAWARHVLALGQPNVTALRA
jgi:integrase